MKLEVFAVVGGERLPMIQDDLNPARVVITNYGGFDEATYYFEAEYTKTSDAGQVNVRRVTSELQVFRLENRYVGNLGAYRGPVGSEIAVQGRGFTKYDQIKVGETETTTQYMSENELRFTVPPLPSGLDYSVKLAGGAHGSLEIGTFRIDESKLGVVPTNLEIRVRDTATLLFKIDYEAPAGGVVVDVKTNVPLSVIMPEALIAEGDKTVNIPIKEASLVKENSLSLQPGLKVRKYQSRFS